jgi:hypothetical protein
MKETNHKKILRILREAKGGWVCTTVFDTEYIRDHRKRVSELIQQGYKIISEQCKGECGRSHSSNIFKRKLVEQKEKPPMYTTAGLSEKVCCASFIIFQVHERSCKSLITEKPTLF